MAQKAIMVRLPEEFDGKSAEELQAAIEEINRELSALALHRVELLKQKKLLEVVLWVLFPDTVPAGYQSVATVVQARLRRARELLAGDGRTKKEEYRAVAEKVQTEERKLYGEDQLSVCCGAVTFEKDGKRYCFECSEPCLWKKKR